MMERQRINRKLSRKIGVSFIFALASLSFFVSCGEQEAYFKYAELKDAQWFQNDTLHFVVDSTDIEPGVPYDITLEITNNAHYDYRNIWLFVRDEMSQHGDSLAFVNKDYVLADEQGRWHGDGFGSLYQVSLPYARSIIFTDRRNHTISIMQGMRDEPLAGIERIGIRIVKSSTN